MATAIQYWNQYGKPPGTHRTPGELARFFDGMDLIEPAWSRHALAARGHDSASPKRSTSSAA